MNRSRAVRTSVVVIASATVLAGGVAMAAQGPGGPGGKGPGGGSGQGHRQATPPPAVNFLHAQGTVKTKTGTEVDDVQSGTVTAISATSIVVTSSDAYVGTYVIATTTKYHGTGSSTTAPVVGDKVDVVAVVVDDVATAKRITGHKHAAPSSAASASASSAATSS